MIDPLATPGIPPRVIWRWSKWLDTADRTARYMVTATVPAGAHSVPVRLISDASHPGAGQVFYVARERFGHQLRQVNG